MNRLLCAAALVVSLVGFHGEPAAADQVAKDENVLLSAVAVESALDTVETRYFLTHGPGFCPPVIAGFGKEPAGAVCVFNEGDTLARPFVYSNASAVGGAILANLVVNGAVRGLDAIPAVRRSHGVLWALLGGVALEGFNVFIHNAAAIHGQIEFRLTK
jgi:hypothetical protein